MISVKIPPLEIQDLKELSYMIKFKQYFEESSAVIYDDVLANNIGEELDLTISDVYQTQRSPGRFGKVWVMTFKGHDAKTKWGMKDEFGFDPKLSKDFKPGDEVKVVLSNTPYYANIASIEKI